MGGALRVLSVGRIPIYVHASWLAVYALITWTLAVGYFPHVLPNLPTAAYWINGLVAALLLFASVLLHELSHSFVARAYGLEVRGITLHVFGGVSQLEDEAPSPRAELLIAVVGPVTSFAIAGIIWGLNAAGLFHGGSTGAIAAYLLFVNVALGLFNLVPGFPLDGGRMLRAVLWRWQGSLPRATYVASRVGILVAFALMALGILEILNGGVIGGFWLMLIGLFLRSAADAGYTQSAVRQALATLPVRDLMAREVTTVPADATVADLVDAFWTHHFTSFPVVDHGAVRGIAGLGQVREVPRERWPFARVADVMRPLDADLVVRPDDTVYTAFEKASHNGVGRLVVLEGPRLAGYLSLKDIAHVLALRGMPGADGDGRWRRPAPPVRRAA